MLFVALGMISLPGLISAQVSEGVLLREQIRSTITADPRASELTQEEFDKLIEALAGQVEAMGQTQDFVAPDIFYEELVPYPNPTPEDRLQFPEAVVYGIVILSLGLALLALRHAHELHHRRAKA